MVQSAAIKQGQSANRKHTYFFWGGGVGGGGGGGLSGSYNISSQIKVSHLIQNRRSRCVIIRLFLAMIDSELRQTANLQCA